MTGHAQLVGGERVAAGKPGPAPGGGTCVLAPPGHTSPSTGELARLSAGILPPGQLNVVCAMAGLIEDGAR